MHHVDFTAWASWYIGSALTHHHLHTQLRMPIALSSTTKSTMEEEDTQIFLLDTIKPVLWILPVKLWQNPQPALKVWFSELRCLVLVIFSRWFLHARERARLGKWRETYALIGSTTRRFLLKDKNKKSIIQHYMGIIYLWRKVVCLFYFVLFVLMRSTEWIRMLQIVFLVSLESSRQRLRSTTFGLVVQKFFEYWVISSLKIKLN
jgi:hypothetical protein